MSFPRRSGLLLSITSLPSRFGIGDLGPEARRFVDFLSASGQSLWQILPLNPPAFGNSPYATMSSFAWNRLLLSPELMVENGVLTADDLTDAPQFSDGFVDFDAVAKWKRPLVARAWRRFQATAGAEAKQGFEQFCSAQRAWLDDYSLFSATKEAHGGREWSAWEPALARRDPAALEKWRTKLLDAVEERKFGQYLFALQWNALHLYCAERGVSLIGDVPIFVAHDSADVWANPGIFQINADGSLPVVAGVPPDLFSKTGQRWGNPLYRWDVLQSTGYAWWLARLRSVLSTVDIVRLDHFLGFLRAWAVPAANATAIKGTWQVGPKAAFFDAVRSELGGLPIIAEDLGLLTAEAEALRDRYDLPGMKVLQFAFGDGPKGSHLPHNSPKNAVIYTGTHDNDTMQGWFQSHCGADGQPDSEARYALRYGRTSPEDFHWGMIELTLASVCDTAIVPAQDLLGLGTEARLNMPGAPEGNWAWRLLPGALVEAHADRLRDISATFGRIPVTSKKTAAEAVPEAETIEAAPAE